MKITAILVATRVVASLQFCNEGMDNFWLNVNSNFQNDGVSTKSVQAVFYE